MALLDFYENEKLGFGKKSLTFTVTYADSTADITDEIADKETETVVSALAEKLGAVRR